MPVYKLSFTVEADNEDQAREWALDSAADYIMNSQAEEVKE